MILVVLLFIIGSAYSVHAVLPIPYKPINITMVKEDLYVWGINGTFEANFASATLTIMHTMDLKVCFSRFALPPAAELYSNKTCELFQQLPNVETPTHYVLPLPAFRDALYFVGVAPSKNLTNVNVTLVVEGTYCNETGYIYNGAECIAPPRFNETKNIVLSPDVPFTFFVEVLPETENGVLDIVQGQNDEAEADLHLLGSYLASPFTQLKHDIDEYNLPATLKLPRQGIWYFKLVNTGLTPIKISSITYRQTFWNATAVLTQYNKDEGNLMMNINSTDKNSGIMYFKYEATHTSTPLIAVIQPYDTNHTTRPTILAALGQLPIFTNDFTSNLNADYVGCNQVDCYTTQRIMAPGGIIPVNQTQTWYVAVMATGATTAHFGFWFGHVCPPRCEIRGQCEYNGDSTGLCTCISVIYRDLDCFTIDHAFNIYDWVLVGIAAALGVIALLGILCFVAMRKHRPTFDKGDYEPVSVN